jgi:hypothetical protein
VNNKIICVTLFFITISGVFASKPVNGKIKIIAGESISNVRIKIDTFDVGESIGDNKNTTIKHHCIGSECSGSEISIFPPIIGFGVVYTNFEFDYLINLIALKIKYPKLDINFNTKIIAHSFTVKYLFDYDGFKLRSFSPWIGLSLDIKYLSIDVESVKLGNTSLKGATIIGPSVSTGVEFFFSEKGSMDLSVKVSLPVNRKENLHGNATIGLSGASIRYGEIQFNSSFSWHF